MDLTIYLARVLGLFLIVAGFAMVVRRRYFMPVIGSFVRASDTRHLCLHRIARQSLSRHRPQCLPVPAAIITAFGWMAVLEAASYLLLPDETIERFVRSFNFPAWYVGGGAVVIALGAYLAAFGFGLI